MKKILFHTLLILTLSLNAQVVGVTPDAEVLNRPFGAWDRELFAQPTKSFYPETWFHFLNGSIGNKAAITADLEAIAQAGFAGIQFFHGQQGDPRDWPGTEEHIECLSPKWESLVQQTAQEAQRLGLRFSMQTCPGWAMSGGPWIKPEQSMRNLCYTRQDVQGGDVNVQLPLAHTHADRNYQDVVVLAFPTPEGDTGTHLVPAEVTANQHPQEWKDCLSGTLKSGFTLQPTTPEHPYAIDVRLAEGSLPRTLEMNPIDAFNHNFGVDPGIHVKVTAHTSNGSVTVLDAPVPRANWQDGDYTLSFALNECAGADSYRIEIVNQHPMHVSRLRLYSAARKNNWEMEAGWTSRALQRINDNPQQNAQAYVRLQDIRDLSDKMDAEGNLRCHLPAGQWTVLRIGHANTCMRNGPAPAEATGWEVNKFDPECVDFQFNSYVGRLNRGPLKGLMNNMLMDSWECKSQNWTARMPLEFRRVSGYDLGCWLPALFGFVIDDPERTSEFLSDFRRTQNDLFVHNFYGRMVENAHKMGLTATYETAAGDIFAGDCMEYTKYADVPMCEFWQPFHHFLANHNYKPIRPTASAAHMYGKPRVSAESFTSFDLTWDEQFSMLREVANQNMVEGVSHLIFHTYTHNPAPDTYCPGTTFGGAIGTPFLRKQTWWKHMPTFTTYLARCSYMLERGKPVSQVLWFIGDEIQQKPDQFALFPQGYTFDYCNADALMNRLSVKDGKWVTPEGIEYDVMWMPDAQRLLPQTVERLLLLVRQGGILIGDAPHHPSTLGDNENQQQRFRQAVSALWGGDTGEGKVLAGISLEEALLQLNVECDVEPADVRWLHRRTEGADWYFICPEAEKDFHGVVTFRCTGNVEVWNPMTGTSETVYNVMSGRQTAMKLDLQRGECVFVIFHHGRTAAPEQRWSQPQTVDIAPCSWTLTFPEGWGIEEPVRLNTLQPWKELDVSEEGRAFSGTATYTTTLQLSKKDKHARYLLNLGKVASIAVVRLNGKEIATLWAEPYQCDVTEALKKGKNTLEIAVTSTWFNRLNYDARLPQAERKTWVISGPNGQGAMRESGLLGPVSLQLQNPEKLTDKSIQHKTQK